LREWVEAAAPGFVLSLSADALPLSSSFPRRRESRASGFEDREALGLRGDDGHLQGDSGEWLLSGPEGGLSPAEEQTALAHLWTPVHLGPRILRAETAPLAALALLTLGLP
jgi:16S rRNA U1498 N3-methylase RsmE